MKRLHQARGARLRWFVLLAAVCLGGAAGASRASAVASVCATVETAPAHNAVDADDDAAVWLHPSNPALSTVIGVDKSITGGGLQVFDPGGSEIQFVPGHGGRRSNNDDVRYNFPLGGTLVDLLGVSTRNSKTLDFYTVSSTTRTLTFAGSVPMPGTTLGIARGFAMYHSPVSGKYFAFVTDSGKTEQYELNGSTGAVTGKLVRRLDTIPQPTEGLVADDELGRVYVAEENLGGGIWRFDAEPGASTTGTKILTTNDTTIKQDIKGLTMYYASGGAGYIIGASQGGDSFHLLNRGDNAYAGEFRIADCTATNGIDGVTAIDGIDVTNASLGPLFPQGAFISHDDVNPGFNQNYKIVPWQAIASQLNLIVDPTYNPRCVGGPCAPPPPSNPPPGPGGTPPGAPPGPGAPRGGTPGGGVVGVGANRADIFRVGVNGSGLRRLTTAPADVVYDAPAWSRDGRRIAFSGPTCAGCANGILVIPAAGGAPRGLRGVAGGAARPSWGRLDRALAFVARNIVWSVSSRGNGVRRLAADGQEHDQAVWSPDGRQVAFTTRQYNGAWDLWVMQANGARKRNLTRSLLSEREPAWSRDGRRIAFSRQVRGRWAVFVMPATGGPARRLTPASVECRQPAWSPNGRQLACSTGTGAGSSILVMKANGTGRRRLVTGTATAFSPAWAPDGRTIAFAGG